MNELEVSLIKHGFIKDDTGYYYPHKTSPQTFIRYDIDTKQWTWVVGGEKLRTDMLKYWKEMVSILDNN